MPSRLGQVLRLLRELPMPFRADQELRLLRASLLLNKATLMVCLEMTTMMPWIPTATMTARLLKLTRSLRACRVSSEEADSPQDLEAKEDLSEEGQDVEDQDLSEVADAQDVGDRKAAELHLLT